MIIPVHCGTQVVLSFQPDIIDSGGRAELAASIGIMRQVIVGCALVRYLESLQGGFLPAALIPVRVACGTELLYVIPKPDRTQTLTLTLNWSSHNTPSPHCGDPNPNPNPKPKPVGNLNPKSNPDWAG